jgi:hypothetical protein
MIPKAIFHSFMQFGACKKWPYVTPYFQRKGKNQIFNQNQISNECVEELLHQDAWL